MIKLLVKSWLTFFSSKNMLVISPMIWMIPKIETESSKLFTQKKDKINGINAAHSLPNKKHIPNPLDLILVGKTSNDKTVNWL